MQAQAEDTSDTISASQPRLPLRAAKLAKKFPGHQGLRSRLRKLLRSAPWERSIIALIVVNAITLGLETSKAAVASFGPLLSVLDTVILSVFVVEISLRIYAFGWKFWRDPWSLFDFFVVAIALVPATGNLSVLRALRIIRVLDQVALSRGYP